MVTPNRLVLGIGNVLQGDEGVGVHVIRRLQKASLPPDVTCLDGGTGGLVLLEPMQEATRILLVDACVADEASDPPGTIRKTRPRYARDFPKTLTAHEVGLKDLLDAAFLLGHSADITLYCIAIDPQQPLSMELSPEIARAADQVSAMVAKDLWASTP